MLYALTLLDSDQEAPAQSDFLLASERASRTTAASCQSAAVRCDSRAATAKEGLAAMKLHVQSLSKFGSNSGALLLPCYGTAELPQACGPHLPFHFVSLSHTDESKSVKRKLAAFCPIFK
jgi:hypothetical protein